MKFEKLTRTLINLALILLVALLVKFLITAPKQMQAQVEDQYKVSHFEQEFATIVEEVGKIKLKSDWWEKMTESEKWTYMFNWNARKGWKFQNWIFFNDDLFLVFKR